MPAIGRRGLLFQTFLAFSLSLVLFSALLSAVLLVGVTRSLKAWSALREGQYREIALSILTSGTTLAEVVVPGGQPMFVYDAAKELVYTNRGLRRRAVGEGDPSLVPVLRDGGTIAGYYAAPESRFQDDAANQGFLDSVYRTAWTGLVAALGISLVAAALLSRGLSRPAREVARSLEAMAKGDFSVRIPGQGARELAALGESANRLAAELEREREIRRQWAQDVAHDLRTPVSGVKAQLEAMRDGVLEVSAVRIGRSIAEIERVERLVVDLAELTRLESPETRLHRERLDAGALLAELGGQFDLDIARRRLSLEVQAGAAELEGDRVLLSRALVNCLSNAVRYAPQGGTVRLTACAGEGVVTIEVSNTGVTIPPDERERVFDRLYRGEAARSTPGSGLGLTIARRIVELHGGRIRATDWPGRGTTMQIVLPLRGPAQGVSESHGLSQPAS